MRRGCGYGRGNLFNALERGGGRMKGFQRAGERGMSHPTPPLFLLLFNPTSSEVSLLLVVSQAGSQPYAS